MSTLPEQISEKSATLLKEKNFQDIGSINFFDKDGDPLSALSERITIYSNGHTFAIKEEIFGPVNKNQPEVTNLNFDLQRKDDLLKYLTDYIMNDPRTVFLNSKEFSNNEQISEIINNSIYNKKQTLMETKTSEQKVKVSGFVGSKFNYNYNEETKKSVISLQIKPKEGDWVHLKAFNQNADLIKNAIENEDIKKLTVTGKMKDAKPYENKKGETVQYQELVVDTIDRHKTVEINGVIAKVEDKMTSNDKPYTHLFIKNNVNVGGVEKVEQFNVTIFQENKKGIPSDVEIKVGQPIAIKGEATINRYLDKEQKVKESVNINAWNVDRTPTRLKEQIKNLQENSSKEKDKPAQKSEVKDETKSTSKKAKTSKSKDSGIGM